MGSSTSDLGDWETDYFDGSSQQHFHFWFFAAVTYYESSLYAYGGNFYHDPYILEPFCGEDLEKFADLEGNKLYDFLAKWHQDAGNANPQDYKLSLAAVEFGRGMKLAQQGPMIMCSFGSCTEVNVYNANAITSPGTWIRTNLKENGIAE